jgi:hypothetical protein
VSTRKFAVVVSGFPRRSETFALGELLALEERGALSAVFATKPGEAGVQQPGWERLRGRVHALPEGDPERQAAFIADRLAGQSVSGVHGYFAHTPAEVAARAAALLGVPYGFSTHARDARKVAPDVLAERARKASCVVACNTDVAEEIRRGERRFICSPTELTCNAFALGPQRRPRSCGCWPSGVWSRRKVSTFCSRLPSGSTFLSACASSVKGRSADDLQR